ncbi:MAG: FAD-dependent monooxygenase [Geodermatophilaceae bacterium]|nr:FAD-dependent monooxygenase [Geodermatophilaceae bacterium]
MVMEKRHQVVIVGGGPVGVGLAVDLGLRGLSCAIIERRTRLSDIPKGQNLTQRTLEHFYLWDIADELRKARTMPPGYPIGQVTAYESLMGEFWHAPPGREIVRPYYFQANERLPQYRTEGVLRRRMADFPNVHNYFGWTATSVEQDADGVRVVVEKDGSQEVLEAEYVVGCDGGRSLVRDQANIERHGTDFDEIMVLIVFRSRELHEALKRFPERSTYRVVHPDLKGYWMFFGRIDVGEGWFFHAPVPAGTTADNFDFEELLHRAAGFEFSCEIGSVGFWDLRVQVAEEYRAGRAFIAGDAAHTHPPYGGFGLNNGLEDVVNLGWKLTAVLGGWGGDRLLDSYSLERRAIFRDIGEEIIAAEIEHERKFLERYSPERDREEFERAFHKLAPASGSLVRSYEPHYEGSPVVIGPPGGVISARGSHSFTARAGHHLAPQPLSSGRNVYEELGTGFTLLAFGAGDADVQTFERAAAPLRIPLKVIRDSFTEGREAYESRLILVRPDQYVVWVGNDAPDDADRLMRTVSGRTSTSRLEDIGPLADTAEGPRAALGLKSPDL